MLNSLSDNLWLATGLWAALFFADYVLTLKAARMYHSGANKHFSFSGGYELNPLFKKDIATLRRVSLRFWVVLFCVGAVLFLVHSIDFPEIFSLVWGMFVGIQVAVHVRHVRNLTIFYYARDSKGVGGKIEYQHWLSLRLSSVELLSFATLFLLLFLFSGSFFLLGGAIGCLSLGLRHLRDSTKGEKNIIEAKA